MSVLVEGKAGKARIIFAHGAGMDMQNPYMDALTVRISGPDIQVVRFNFPYMEQRRVTGKKRPPDRMPVLLEAYRKIIDSYEDDVPLFLMGKSMGGRVATLLLEETRAKAAFVVGYPFHPIGNNQNLRIDHLAAIVKPLSIFQGTRDKLGNLDEVQTYHLPSNVKLHWFEDGDHDLKPRKVSGHTQEEYLDTVARSVLVSIEEAVNVPTR